MGVTEVVQVISTVGFPIAMCIVMAWYIKYNNDQHKEEMKQVTEAVNNNTLVVQKLIDSIGKEDMVC